MAKGDILHNSFREYTDPHTGAHVVRLTAPDAVCHHPYFYYKMMTNDSRSLIYARQQDGRRNFYRMDLRSGDAVQLTDAPDIRDYDANLTSDDRYLIFSRGDCLVRMDMASLREEVVFETPAGWRKGGVSISSDDRFAVVTAMDLRDEVKGSGGWSFFRPQCAAHPRSRIIRIDMGKKQSRTILEQKCWLGHAQFRPNDSGTILYCHEGPWDMIDARLWLMDGDGGHVRCARAQNGVVMTHEFWLPDGSRFGYVYRETKGPQTETIRFIDPDTLREEVLMECSRYKHFIADPTGQWLTGDGELPGRLFIYLVDMRKKQEHALCFHGSQWKSYGSVQDSHPHPAFSPDGRFVVFTSDREGMPCIYKAERM